MILLIDVGNTRIKWGCWEMGELSRIGADSHARENFAAFATNAWGTLPVPERVIVSNVGSSAFGDALATWIYSEWELEAEFILSRASGYGVTNAYTDSYKLGPDRWAALIAAYKSSDGPACIVSAGTAITIDVLGEEGRHQGGLIVPGLHLMRRSLTEKTSGIVWDGPRNIPPGSLLARDTKNAVTAGTLYAVVALIDRVVQDVAAEVCTTLDCIICGGDAEALLPLLGAHFRHEPHLVLKGLAEIAIEG